MKLVAENADNWQGKKDMVTGLVTNIQGYSIHDGPGIRTVVFLKGCGLECRWCSNPECISPLPQVGLVEKLCTRCGKCVGVCPAGALVYEDGRIPRIDRKLCTGCGECSARCSYQALVQYGRKMSADEIFRAVQRDAIFYQASGGGVTVSGGEALLQPELVLGLFEKCCQAGIHTCVETSGYAAGTAFNTIMPYTDLFLFDLKHMNPEKHRQHTGKPNDLVLANARMVAASGVETLFRMPLIPGINDDENNIKATAAFLRELGNKHARIELMPYHKLGKGKYQSLSMEYSLPEILVPVPDDIERVKKAFEANGIMCLVSR
jgi:pyruvate formate lyase activating enzyme